MRNAGLDEAQAGIKIAGRDINNLRYTDDTTFMAPWKKNNEKPRQQIKKQRHSFPKKVRLSTKELMLLSCVVGEDS